MPRLETAAVDPEDLTAHGEQRINLKINLPESDRHMKNEKINFSSWRQNLMPFKKPKTNKTKQQHKTSNGCGSNQRQNFASGGAAYLSKKAITARPWFCVFFFLVVNGHSQSPLPYCPKSVFSHNNVGFWQSLNKICIRRWITTLQRGGLFWRSEARARSQHSEINRSDTAVRSSWDRMWSALTRLENGGAGT